MTTKTKPGFQKGKSGNPAGRPKGSKNRATLLALAAMEGELDAIVKRIIDAAKGGDMAAARLVIDKLIPAAKENRLRIALPAINDVAGCTGAQAKVLQAVTAGDLLPGEAETLSALIENQRRGLESHDIAARLLAVEAELKRQPRGNAR
jgi:hypothetical protein